MKKHKYTNKWKQENNHKYSRKERIIKELSCPINMKTDDFPEDYKYYTGP